MHTQFVSFKIKLVLFNLQIFDHLLIRMYLGPSIIDIICLNQTLRIFIVLLGTCVLLPVTVYLLCFSHELENEKFTSQQYGTCSHYPIYHVSCGKKVLT